MNVTPFLLDVRQLGSMSSSRWEFFFVKIEKVTLKELDTWDIQRSRGVRFTLLNNARIIQTHAKPIWGWCGVIFLQRFEDTFESDPEWSNWVHFQWQWSGFGNEVVEPEGVVLPLLHYCLVPHPYSERFAHPPQTWR